MSGSLVLYTTSKNVTRLSFFYNIRFSTRTVLLVTCRSTARTFPLHGSLYNTFRCYYKISPTTWHTTYFSLYVYIQAKRIVTLHGPFYYSHRYTTNPVHQYVDHMLPRFTGHFRKLCVILTSGYLFKLEGILEIGKSLHFLVVTERR